MSSALQLLVDAPDREVKRMQIVYREIAKGAWDEAAFHLSNITRHDSDSIDTKQWINDALELCDFCRLANRVSSKSL